MPVAAMANLPEHDFAPSWLKIPDDNQVIAKTHSDQRAGSKFHSDSSRSRSRHPSNESYPGYLPRNPSQPSIHGYRSRDEKRYRPGPRYHSLEDPLRHSDLPDAYAPLNQHNGFLPPPPSPLSYFPSPLDYPYHHGGKRSSSSGGGIPPLHPHGYHHGGRSNLYEGGGRSRYGSGGGKHGRGGANDKAGPENGEMNGMENGGGRNGDGSMNGDEGKTKRDKSALSSHDFPSLSGDGDGIKTKSESSKPAGAWEKRPGTAKISIGGKKLQLVQKMSSGTANDATNNGTNGSSTTAAAAAGKMSPSGVGNLSSSIKGGAVVQQSVQNKASKLSSTGTSVYKSLMLVPKSSTTNKATTPRKPIAKEVVIRPPPVISSKDKPPPTSLSSSLSSSSSSSSSTTSSSSSSTSMPSPSGGGSSSQSSSSASVKEQASPRSTPAMDIPSPRLVTGSKVKRTDKIDFLKELRRTSSVDSPRSPLTSTNALTDAPMTNGDSHLHHHDDQSHSHHHHQQPDHRPQQQQQQQQQPYHQYQYRSSTKQYESRTNAATIYQQPDPFEDVDVDEPSQDSLVNTQHHTIKCNGHLEHDDDVDVDEELDLGRDDLVTDNGHLDVVSPQSGDEIHVDCQPMELSSSLEAEKRLLQEMGWHEHSDNEEGYAPITEDELKEFKLRSQQMKKNGFSRPSQPVILNLLPHPVISAMTTMVIDDAELSSSDESSDDDL